MGLIETVFGRNTAKSDNNHEKLNRLADQDGVLPRRRVDMGVYEPKGLVKRVFSAIKRKAIPLAMPVLRLIGVRKFFGIYWVARDAEVRAVLNDHAAFNVPYGPEMRHITQGVTFCLGDDGELHERQLNALKEAWAKIDNDAYVRAPVRKIASALIEDCGGQVDVSGELIRQVIARMLDELLACPVENHTAFSDSLISIGTMIFADPYGTRETRDEGRLGGRVMRPVIDNCVGQALARSKTASEEFDGIIPEMARSLRAYMERQADDPDAKPYGEEDLRQDLEAIAYGMPTGFAVTHTFFTGIMATLGERQDVFSDAVDLARAIVAARQDGDAARERETLNRFEQVLLEASRFQPAIQPGTFRIRTKASRSTMPQSKGLDRIPPGSTVLACMISAVKDPRGVPAGCPHPRVFDPDRLAPDALTTSLGFGSGLHHCLGAEQAIAITSETLICLLSQPNIRYRDPKPKVKYIGVIPGELAMVFDPPTGALEQSQIFAALPMDEACDCDVAMRVLKDVQERGALGDAYTASNIVHFSSLNIARLGKRGKERPHLLVELNVDGRRRIALDRLTQFVSMNPDALADMSSILRLLPEDTRALVSEKTNAASVFFGAVLARGETLSELPWGTTGLDFVGTGEFSVKQIEREKELADKVFGYLVNEAQTKVRSDHFSGGLLEGPLRDQITAMAETEDFATRFFHNTRTLLRNEDKHRGEEEFEDLLIRLPARGPAFARAEQVSFRQYLVRYASQTPLKITAGIYVLLPFALLVLGVFFCSSWFGVWPFVAVWVVPVLLLITLLAGLVYWLRAKEASESQNKDRVDIERLRRIRDAEERANHAQTHITSVSDFKPGLFRRLTFALAMHVIKSFVRLWFRPGFLTDFATIHYARWVRVKGTDQMIFQSNYDGSWESYLEDFITKVHQGQTLAWNNAKGFPKTNWLWFDGARDGDRFKRWVRNQQIETPFWYSRFPDLTIPQIQMNALIRDGLARAGDVSDHRAWLKLFGSVPRNGTELEADQIQSLVFHPHQDHELAVCLPVFFAQPDKAQVWLSLELYKSVNVATAGGGYTMAAAGGEMPTPVLSFGDGEPGDAAMFIAVSAGGLAKLGLSEEPQSGLHSFPSAFLDGMSGRAAALDDPAHVIWGDTGWKTDPETARQNIRRPTDAVLLLYLRRPSEMVGEGAHTSILSSDAMKEFREKFTAQLKQSGIEIQGFVDMSRAPKSKSSLGGFGFHEGASQPKIKGTRAAAKRGVLERDILPPGEFLVGYEDLRGYVAPPIQVREGHAARRYLPHSAKPRPEPYPYFADPKRGHMFDFGRNGSFLVVRQLAHNKSRRMFPVNHAQGNVQSSSPAAPAASAFDTFVQNEADKLAKTLELDPGSVMTLHSVQDADFPIYEEAYKSGWNRFFLTELDADRLDQPPWNDPDGRRPVRQSDSQNRLIYSAERTFLKELIRAKMIGRWKDGSSLVRHPILSATGLLRRRTLRQLEKLIGPEPFHEILIHMPKPSLTRVDAYLLRDRVLWDDDLWDDLVTNMRQFAEGEKNPNTRTAILSHRWLKQSYEWPSVSDNNFNFGRDDPQGLACPIGAHIRRSNPRDTPNPDNPTQFDLNNRHRILRRGRTFRLSRDASIRGTHFMCLNSDIERQYEFIQRTWLNAPDFQGLVKQPDPIAAPHKAGDRFIIPHTSNLTALELCPAKNGSGGAPGLTGFTRLIGGGYFFLPSRAALSYLSRVGRMPH